MLVREIRWAAGFLEGEGYFSAGGSSRRTALISATQVNPEPLYRLQRALGGNVVGPYQSKRPNTQPHRRWQIFGDAAAGVMMTLYVELSQKRREEICKALAIWKAAIGNPRTWQARGFCKNGHALSGENYIVAPSGHGRCRQCGIASRRAYYARNKNKWRGYAARKSNVIPLKAKLHAG